MNYDEHFIDDPLLVVNTKPDFSNLGMEPMHHNRMAPENILACITKKIPNPALEAIVGTPPLWLKPLPDDWEGETTRAHIRLMVSKQAIINGEFDLKGFVRIKLLLAMKHIMRKHGWSEIHLTRNFTATVDAFSDDERTLFDFHIEYENQ